MTRGPRAARAVWRALLIPAVVVLQGGGAHAAAVPTHPLRLLAGDPYRTPPIDATRSCAPDAGPTDPAPPPRTAADAPRGRAIALLREARRASEREERIRVRAALRLARQEDLAPALASCVGLELARLELRLGLLPESGASARRALRGVDGEEPDPSLRAAAEFLRAEALYLGGHGFEAYALYRELATSSDTRLAAAARLRLADVDFDGGQPARAMPVYEVLLERAEAFGAHPLAWAPRAAEAALAAGDLTSSRSWFDRLVESAPSEAESALASIRLADVLALQGRLDASRNLLLELDALHDGEPEGMLARIRLFDLGVHEEDEAEALRILRAAVDPASPSGVTNYARTVLARLLLEGGQLDEALDLLVRVSYDASIPALSETARTHLERAVGIAADAAVDVEGCALLVVRLGGRRGLLSRSIGDPAPLLRLGACYEMIGLPRVALDVYRAMTRAFGGRVAEAVALPVARASLAAGDLALARTAAEVRVASPRGRERAWVRLLAEARLAEHEPERAAELFAEWARDVEGPVDAETLLLLARAAPHAARDAPYRELLYTELERALAGAGRDGAATAAAGLLTANLLRAEAALPRARRLYRELLSADLAAPLHAEAAYWEGALSPSPGSLRRGLERAAAGGQTPYARLAREGLALEQLRAGLSLPLPSRLPVETREP